ncbi:MAG: glycosyltransferase family 2 protein [Gammaproteobacteria bacterium]|nr:glycosyltransferase family 2 protein [Gammaproteobacteria bacterium]
MQTRDTVAAVIVLHHPDLQRLSQLLARLAGSLRYVILVDNSGETGQCNEYSHPQLECSLIRNKENLGIAAALNLGLNKCLAQGYVAALLLDQDSVPAEEMVPRLHRAWCDARGAGVALAAVGPAIFDELGQRFEPFIRFGLPFNRRLRPDGVQSATVAVDFLVTSGCLVSLDALSTVGFMDPSLFIDSVDFEWCFRAKARGFELLGVPVAHLQHRRGETYRPFGARSALFVRYHQPIRQYYIVRNRLSLYGRKETPLAWIAQDLPRMIIKCLLFSLAIPPRRRNAIMIWNGIRDAWRRRLGPCQVTNPK